MEVHVRPRMRRVEGYALIETMVAAAIIVTLAAGIGYIATMTSRAVQSSGRREIGLVAALQKIEQLKSLSFSYDAESRPVTDRWSNLAVEPIAADGRGLQPTPSLRAASTGQIDYLDADGRWIGTGVRLPSGATFARRWSVGADTVAGTDIRVLQVAVVSLADRRAIDWSTVDPGYPGVTWIATARARR